MVDGMTRWAYLADDPEFPNHWIIIDNVYLFIWLPKDGWVESLCEMLGSEQTKMFPHLTGHRALKDIARAIKRLQKLELMK